MEFSLRSAYAYGTGALRTHIDSVGAQTRISWPVFAEARERWRGRIELQASPLFSIEFALDPSHMADIEAMLDAHGTGILGAVTYMVPRLSEGLAVLFALAERKGWALDFHVDESADPAARSLSVVADMAIARRFPRPILVGHCCSLALQEEDVVHLRIRFGGDNGLCPIGNAEPSRLQHGEVVCAVANDLAPGTDILVIWPSGSTSGLPLPIKEKPERW